MRALVLLAILGVLPAAAQSAIPNPFFAFDNGVGRGSLKPEQQAEVLSRHGYAGIGYSGTENIPEVLRAMESRGLKLFSIYVGADVDKGSYDPGLPQAIQQLKGHDTLIFLYITGNKGAAEEPVVAMVREIAGMAEKSSLRVALYPHVGFYVDTVEQGLRVADRTAMKNVGLIFNLCHWLKAGGKPEYPVLLRQALPRLMAVSINGADHVGNWDRLIQPLDRGEFDVSGLLKTLRALNFAGPIGLQCYNVQGDIEENLSRSMTAWRQLTKQSVRMNGP